VVGSAHVNHLCLLTTNRCHESVMPVLGRGSLARLLWLHNLVAVPAAITVCNSRLQHNQLARSHIGCFQD
jgi:hypothetical protein